MPRPTAPPRLWLRKRRDGTDQWVILDTGRQIRTGAPAQDRRKAEKALERYLGRKHKPDFGDGHPARVAIADALAAYSEKHAPTTKRPDLIGSAALKLAEFFGGKTCAVINATACNDYVAWRSAQCNWSPSPFVELGPDQDERAFGPAFDLAPAVDAAGAMPEFG